MKNMKRSSKILVAVSATLLLVMGASGIAGCSNREARNTRNMRNDTPVVRREHHEFNHQHNERITQNNTRRHFDDCRDGACGERVYRNGRYFTAWGNRNFSTMDTPEQDVPTMANAYTNNGNYAAYDPDFSVNVRNGAMPTYDNRNNAYASSSTRAPRRTSGNRYFGRRDVYAVDSPYNYGGRMFNYFRTSNGYVRDGAVGDRPGFIGDEGRYMRSSSRYANRNLNRSTYLQPERNVVTRNYTRNTTRVERLDENGVAARNGRTMAGTNYTFWGVIIGLIVSAVIITLVALIVPRRRRATNVNHKENHKRNDRYKDWD